MNWKFLFFLIILYPVQGVLGQDADAGTTAANDWIGIYQRYIGGVRGGECPMYPSCSNYALQAFQQTNFVTGGLATTDRLMRCAHDHRHYGITLSDQGFKLVDLPPGSAEGDRVYYQPRRPVYAYGDLIRDDSTTAFIKRLVNLGYHREALLEIERVRFQTGTLSNELFVNKLACLIATDQLEEGLYAYATECGDGCSRNVDVLYLISRIHYLAGNYTQAISYTETSFSNIIDDHFLESKLLNTKALSFARMGEWNRTHEVYKLLATTPGYEAEGLYKAKIAQDALNLKKKSPILAGGLSALVPGLGFAYAGFWQTGISALLINGMLGYATYSNIQNENYGMAVLTGVFNLAFYMGTLSGSAKSATKRNKNKYSEKIIRLENKSIF